MKKTNSLISLLILYLCISLSYAETTGGKQTTGTQQFPGSEDAIAIKSQDQQVKKGDIRFHQFRSQSSLKLNNPNYKKGQYGGQIQILGNQHFALFEDSENALCKRNKFRRCYLAVGHGYDNNRDQNDSTTPNGIDDTFSVAYIGYNEADNYAIAFQQGRNDIPQNWEYTFVHAADKANPFNQNSDQQADCDKQVQLEDFETTRSEYAQRTLYDKGFSSIITQKQQNYNFGLLTQKDDVSEQGPCDIDPQEDISLRGQAQTTLKRTVTKDVPQSIAAQYRTKIGTAPRFISKSGFQRFRQQKGKLAQTDDGQQPDFSQIDNIDDPSLPEPIDFERYLDPQSKADFEKDYPQRTFQTRVLTVEQPPINVNVQQQQTSRLLPVVATHTLYEQTKIIYSKTVLGKKIQVKLYAKCKLIISTAPTKHQVQCFGQIIYKVFSVTKTKTIFSFKKQVAANWSWNKNWGGNWGFSFAVPLPPPVSFITIHFYVTVGYKINLAIYSKIKQWWYPLIHQVKAVASSELNVDATASIRVVAIEGGVFIKGTIVKVSTDPTATLYYYLKYYHKFIIVWVKWYWEIIAFKFQWGFKWRYWFFGWKPWKIIAKWTINGLYGKYKILNKAFFLKY